MQRFSEKDIIEYMKNKVFEIGASTEDEGTGDVFKVPVIGYMFICFDKADKCYRVEPILHPSFDFHHQVGYNICNDEELIQVLPAIPGDYAIIGCCLDDDVTYSDVLSESYDIHTEILCHVVSGTPDYNWEKKLRNQWKNVLIQNFRCCINGGE